MSHPIFAGLNKNKTLVFLFLLAAFTTLTYSNHFENGFHFDDSHTIETNVFIKDLKNIPLFFSDGKTFSSLPQNQSYRPVVSTSLAFDYWLGSGLQPFYFHLSTFLLFIFLGFLMFFLSDHLFRLSSPHPWNFYIAAATVSWYMLHPANAETVNYIIARSDLQSSLFVVIAFVLYVFSDFARKYHLYLIPVAIGALAKPPAIMFAPMLVVYILLFKYNMGFQEILNKDSRPVLRKIIIDVLPAIIFCLFLYLFIQYKTPDTWVAGGTSTFLYLITQPWVILHYFISFFLPLNLSADTDWLPLQSVMDLKFLTGLSFILFLLLLIIKSSKEKRLRPLSFGLSWFLLALIPSSSFIAFAEVMNDHRVFFPYIGLSIAVCWIFSLSLRKISVKYPLFRSRFFILPLVVLILTAYAYGTIERNKVWKTEESLWRDVTIKSPGNGRGLMNYGLALMAKGEYQTANYYFNEALKVWPSYPYLHINLGVLNSSLNNPDLAESYFREGIRLGSAYPETWFFYGRFLYAQKRMQEAESALRNVLSLSHSHMGARQLLMQLYFEQSNFDSLLKIAGESLSLQPNDPMATYYLKAGKEKKGSIEVLETRVVAAPTAEGYLNLSLLYYQNGHYEKCIDACYKALKIDPKMAAAYNNIGSAHSMMGRYEEAASACKEALALDPGFSLAENNLRDALSKMKNTDELSAGELLNKSLNFYRQGNYAACISSCEKALKIKPDFADAYSNIAASYIMLGKLELAEKACKQALKIDPQHKLAQGNLDWALREKAKRP